MIAQGAGCSTLPGSAMGSRREAQRCNERVMPGTDLAGLGDDLTDVGAHEGAGHGGGLHDGVYTGFNAR